MIRVWHRQEEILGFKGIPGLKDKKEGECAVSRPSLPSQFMSWVAPELPAPPARIIQPGLSQEPQPQCKPFHPVAGHPTWKKTLMAHRSLSPLLLIAQGLAEPDLFFLA